MNDLVELLREHPQRRIALGVLFVEPLHIDHVGNARDVAPPIAVLFFPSRLAVPVQDWLDILDMLNREVLTVGVEMDLNGHQ